MQNPADIRTRLVWSSNMPDAICSDIATVDTLAFANTESRKILLQHGDAFVSLRRRARVSPCFAWHATRLSTITRGNAQPTLCADSVNVHMRLTSDNSVEAHNPARIEEEKQQASAGAGAHAGCCADGFRSCMHWPPNTLTLRFPRAAPTGARTPPFEHKFHSGRPLQTL